MASSCVFGGDSDARGHDRLLMRAGVIQSIGRYRSDGEVAEAALLPNARFTPTAFTCSHGACAAPIRSRALSC
jgi:hypothetical protein